MVSRSDIKDRLLSLGYALSDDGPKAWRCRAVYRNGKNPASMLIYKDSGVWTDFGAGVFSKPFSYLLEQHGIKDDGVINRAVVGPEDIVDEVEEAQADKVYPPTILDRLIPHHKFYLDKGIGLEVLARLKGGMAMSGKMYQRYVFPIFNSSKQIIGFSGRYLGSNPDRPKWKHLGNKRTWVYPFYLQVEGQPIVQDAILKNEEVVFVESVGDMLAFHNRGVFNVIPVFGLVASAAVICSVLSLSPQYVTLAFNNDAEKGAQNTGYIACINNFLTLLDYFDYESLRVCLPIKKDFGEMNEIDFNQWLRQRYSVDFDQQRDKICEDAHKYVEEDKNEPKKRIRVKSLKNLGKLCG